MTKPMSDFYNRIHKLSQKKRQLLAIRFRESLNDTLAPYEAIDADSFEEQAKRLQAYLVIDHECSPSIDELRQFLNEKLPDFMVPTSFVFLDEIPLNSNGKVDRLALSSPDEVALDISDTFIAPRTLVEEKLAEIWSEVIGLDMVGIHDDFFEMGGDSILSIRIIAKANQAGIRISPEIFFQNPTIAQLAPVVGTESTVRAEQELITGPVPLTPIQHRFFEQDHTDPHCWNQAVLLEASGDLKAIIVEQALQHLLFHHDALRLCFVPEGAKWQQFHGESKITVTEMDLSTLSKSEVRAAIEDTATQLHKSLDLAKGGIVKAVLFRLGAQKSIRLLIVVHHLAVDTISWRIILEDLETACRQLNRGEAIELPTKTTSFKYWSEKLSEYAYSDEILSELDYWLNKLRSSDVSLPVDYAARGANTAASIAVVSDSLSIAETERLLHNVRKAYHTQMNVILLMALVQVLVDWTGRSSVCFWLGRAWT